MRDTPPEIEDFFSRLLMKKTGAERLKMGFSMFNFARKQVEASIISSNPRADSREIKREIFMRFYGQDFTAEEQEKILPSDPVIWHCRWEYGI